MTTRQQSSVVLLSGGMSQSDEHLNKQQQLQMQRVLPSSSGYPAPLYSLASNADSSRVRSTSSTKRMRNNDKSIACNLCYEVELIHLEHLYIAPRIFRSIKYSIYWVYRSLYRSFYRSIYLGL